MAIYYTINLQGLSTNSSAATETDHLRTVTGSTRSASFVQIIASARGSTVGGATIRLRRFQTPATGGSAVTPLAKDQGGQASTITASSAPSTGTGTNFNVASIGFSQTGAQGFWGAAEPNDAILLNASGGQSGNMDIISIANASTIPFDLTSEHIE